MLRKLKNGYTRINQDIRRRLHEAKTTPHLQVRGRCPICEKRARFRAEEEWLRDHFFCSRCQSIPRERALMQVISDEYPHYRSLHIHECSPAQRGVSVKLKQQCQSYSSSHFYPDLELGAVHPEHGHRCENLERLTFDDNVFDLFISQDVMEHIYEPDLAFREIARVLKPGGAHIFTAPLINKDKATVRWATRGSDGEPNFLFEPEYHGNPIDPKGSPVTMHWGYDIADYIEQVAGTPSRIVALDDLDAGIRAEYIEVVISEVAEQIAT